MHTITRSIWFLGGVLLMAAAMNAQAAEPAAGKSPLTAETMWQMKRLGSPAVSPDGAWTALTVTTYDVDKNEGTTVLWLVPTAGGEARQFTSQAAGAPVWSPDGRWIAFTAKREGDDAPQIYLLPTAGGEARRLTEVPTGVSGVKWFPDSQRLAFLSEVWPGLSWENAATRVKEKKDAKMNARVWNRPWIRYWDHWLEEDREPHIFTVGLAGGELTAVTLGTGVHLTKLGAEASSYDISPDGAEIAFAAEVDPTGVDGNLEIYVVPAAGGQATNLTTDNPADDDSPLYSPDGRYLAFGRQTIKDFYGDRVRLVLHDRQSRTNRVVTDAWDRSATGLVWAPDSKSLYGAIDDAGNDRVYRIDAATGQPQPLTREHSFSNLSLSHDGNTLVALRQSFVEPPTLVRIDPARGAVTKLSTFNDAILAGIDFGTYESVTYTGASGEPIQMWISYPPGFDRTKKWPLYLLIHGGPHNGITDGFHWRWSAQAFSAWGYVTAWHNFHGSSGFGQAFTDSINPNRADLPYEDTIRAADYFAQQPWIDAERMTAGGGSYGGYLATVLLGRPHPFKALVAHAAVYNLFTQYASDYGASKRRHGEFWSSPEAMETMQHVSPHFGAGNFNTPTLVIHGEQDFRVPINHGIELFNTLQNRGVKSRLIVFPDENHWVLKPQNSLFWYQNVGQWLDETIGHGPTS